MAAMPEYTVPKEQASALLGLALLLPFAKTLVGAPGRQGIRFVFFGIFTLESYNCYAEPILDAWKGLRIILWKTKKNTKATSEWRRFPGVPIGNTHAIAYVHEDFLHDWSANARRLVPKQKDALFCKAVSLEEFGKAYQASGYLDPFLRHGFLRVIKDHLRVHPQDVSILFFYTHDQQLAGGTVFVDYPDIQQSHYLISFLTEEGRKEKAGYAFIYWWYQDMVKKGIRWADFGIIWAPGDPISWKGYSQFKKRFNPMIHRKVSYWKRG